jgi:hypothetical protein
MATTAGGGSTPTSFQCSAVDGGGGGMGLLHGVAAWGLLSMWAACVYVLLVCLCAQGLLMHAFQCTVVGSCRKSPCLVSRECFGCCTGDPVVC